MIAAWDGLIVLVMSVRYLCDSCGFHGVDPTAHNADEVLCEVCGEPVLADPQGSDQPQRVDRRGRKKRDS